LQPRRNAAHEEASPSSRSLPALRFFAVKTVFHFRFSEATMTNKSAQFLAHHQGTILKLLLSLIVVIFIGILFTAYLVARRANPIFLDEHGKPVNTPTTKY
jgi:hypothetical protein